MRKSYKMQGLFKQVFQGFVVTGTRVYEGVVDIVPGESEVSQLGKGSQVFSGFLLFHLFQMQNMLDLNKKKFPSYLQLYKIKIRCTGISSQIRTKLRDWAVWQARGRLLLSGSNVLK